jgi:hypothetical protein
MAIDWSKIFKRHRGNWVAFASDEQTVVGSGTTAKKALQSAERKGITRPILMKMPPKLVSYVGSSGV